MENYFNLDKLFLFFMENKQISETFAYIKDEEFLCQNMRQISVQIKKIKKRYFDNVSSNFTISVFLFKKISKDYSIAQLTINKYIFELTFDFSNLTKETKKEQRKSFPSNLIDEILENFPNFSELKYVSDCISFLAPYSLKLLMKEFKNAKKLELNNILIAYDNSSLEQIKLFTNFTKLESVTLYFHFKNLESSIFFETLNQIFSANLLNKANFHIFFNQINIISFMDKNLMTPLKGSSINNIDELHVSFVKFDPEKSILVSDQQRGLIIPIFLILMNKYWPTYIDFKYNEIAEAAKDQHFFKKISIKYKEEFSDYLRCVKNEIFGKFTKNGIKTRFFDVFNIFSQLSFKNDKMFEPKFMNLMLRLEGIEKASLLKWSFGFIQELEGFEVRKQYIDDLMGNLNNRRKINKITFSC